jgi:hypothetical protein
VTAVDAAYWAVVVTHGRGLDEVVIIDEDGAEVEGRALPEDAVAPGVWDRAVANCGFRVEQGSRWVARGGQMTRSVVRLAASPSP